MCFPKPMGSFRVCGSFRPMVQRLRRHLFIRPSKVFLPLVVTLVTQVSKASPEKACFERELDPRTRSTYTSQEVYQRDLTAWMQTPRPEVSYFDRVHAYAVFLREYSTAKKFRVDKVQHCYIGCAIGAATSPEVADYAGWIKEYDDLTDCRIGTHFEPADAQATSWGGHSGAKTSEVCAEVCTVQFGRRRKGAAPSREPSAY